MIVVTPLSQFKPHTHYDVVVIGPGMGGLTTASLLAQLNLLFRTKEPIR